MPCAIPFTMSAREASGGIWSAMWLKNSCLSRKYWRQMSRSRASLSEKRR